MGQKKKFNIGKHKEEILFAYLFYYWTRLNLKIGKFYLATLVLNYLKKVLSHILVKHSLFFNWNKLNHGSWSVFLLVFLITKLRNRDIIILLKINLNKSKILKIIINSENMTVFSVIQNVYCHKVQFFHHVFNGYIFRQSYCCSKNLRVRETNPSKNNYIDAKNIIKTINKLFFIGKTQYVN